MGGGDNGFLGRLDAATREALLKAGTERRCRAGRPVYEERRPERSVAVLLEGRVKVATVTRDGAELLLGLRAPGDLLGELSSITGDGRSATVTAIDDVRLSVVPHEAFAHLLATHPAMTAAVMETLASRVVEGDMHRIELEQSTEERVARVLVRLAERFGRPSSDGSVSIDLPLTQDELAGLTWASRGAVASALRQLRDEGIVQTARRRIVVLDLERLRDRTP